MATAPVLIVLIAAGELRSPATEGMIHGARETLGPDVTLRLETYNSGHIPAPPKSDSGQAYVVLNWQNNGHDAATISGRLPGSNEIFERSLAFAPADPEDERGRSIGVVIASIVAGIMPLTKSEARASVADTGVTVLEPRRPHALSLAAAASLPRSSNAFGAFVDAAYGVTSAFDAGVYFETRFGAIPKAQASTRWLSLGAIGRVRLFPLSKRTFASVVLQVGVTQLAISHLSEDDAEPDEQVAYLPTALLALRLSTEISQHTSIYADMGATAQAGTVTIDVHGATAAMIPPIFAGARLGVLARF